MVVTPLDGSRAVPELVSAAGVPGTEHQSKFPEVIAGDAVKKSRQLPIVSLRDAEPANLVLQSGPL